jgi:predicted double-glycine peptidase
MSRGAAAAFMLITGCTAHYPLQNDATDGSYVPVQVRGGYTQAVTVSFSDMRFQDLVRQQTDITCGAAALATILRHYYGMDASEGSVAEEILTTATPPQKASIARYGFSMLELKKAATQQGLEAGGFRLEDPERLRGIEVPVIALIQVRGYAHFVVVRGMAKDKVFVADPAFGNRTVDFDDFVQSWDGVVLVAVPPDGSAGQASFIRDFAVYGRSNTIWPVLDSGLRTIAPMPGEF